MTHQTTEALADRDAAIRIWHKHCGAFRSVLGQHPASVTIDAMLEFAALSSQPPAPREPLTELTQPSAPQAAGAAWRQVPIRPTEAMLQAGLEASHNALLGAPTANHQRIYASMLAASPLPQGREQAALPEGWKLVLVNDGFDDLMGRLERAHSKGYLPDAITEGYEGFDYRATYQLNKGMNMEIFLTEEQAEALRDMIGAQDASPISLVIGDGHSGQGLYASLSEYQEEGAVLICQLPNQAGELA